MILGHDEMLNLWMLHRYGEPLATEGALTRQWGLDVEALAAGEMRAWYDRLLTTAPVGMLETDDIARRLEPVLTADGAARLTLPDDVVRLLSIRLDGWERPAVPVAGFDSPEARRQCNCLTRGGRHCPVAVAEGSTVMLYTPVDRCVRVAEALAITRPPEGTYRLRHGALTTIAAYEYK